VDEVKVCKQTMCNRRKKVQLIKTRTRIKACLQRFLHILVRIQLDRDKTI